MKRCKSAELMHRARNVIPGGVNSPVRSFKAVNTEPFLVKNGYGSKIKTVDGDELIDFCCSWGPLILGHAHPAVVEAVCKTVRNGSSFGISTVPEVELAELLCKHIPYLDQVRLVNSGTEAVMTAIRLARGFTGKSKIIKFDGCYHGHADYLLISGGSGLLSAPETTSAGVPKNIIDDVIVLPYNDINSVKQSIKQYGNELAAIIVEPVAGNMGLVIPDEGFLETLREVCDSCGAVLIFDEVITGFRFGPTSYGVLAGVTPDLTCLGKIIGGGLPIGGIGGKKKIMEFLAPTGPVYQAGTLSGNPVAVSAGLVTLKHLLEQNPYNKLAEKGIIITQQLNMLIKKTGVAAQCIGLGSVFTIFFQNRPVHNLNDAKHSNLDNYSIVFQEMLNEGIYLPPSQFELSFLSTAHSDEDIGIFLRAAEKVFTKVIS